MESGIFVCLCLDSLSEVLYPTLDYSGCLFVCAVIPLVVCVMLLTL
jgi:hypothetical protein